MPNDSHDTDGRSLWWMIPAACASVLGVAGAAILRSRKLHERAAPTPSVAREEPATTLMPLADPPAEPDDSTHETSATV
ncbi:MAG: hypothetical protein QM589_03435 [Thermomicrobiales bacterium]